MKSLTYFFHFVSFVGLVSLAKNYQNRSIAFIENGSWAPAAAKKMREYTDKMANINYYDKVISIKTTVKQSNIDEMTDLINWAKQ